eukprot:9413702-Pyramimonas_sp.AAC.1
MSDMSGGVSPDPLLQIIAALGVRELEGAQSSCFRMEGRCQESAREVQTYLLAAIERLDLDPRALLLSDAFIQNRANRKPK